MADEIQKIKVSELPNAVSLENLAILGVDLSTNGSVKALMSLLRGLDGKNVELQKTTTYIQWRIAGGTWANLVAVADLKGATGANIELQKTSTHLQWRVAGASTWNNLVPLDDLKVKGDPGASVEMQVSPTHIQWRITGSDTWINLIPLSEVEGAPGKNVELQKTTTHIQWRIAGGTWANLVALSDLKGDRGGEVELQKTTTHIQWRITGGTWANLVALSDLKGETGPTPAISIGTVTTVPAGGQSSATMVEDGVDGNGVKKYKLNLVLVQGATGEVENIDTATIAFSEAAARTNVNSGDTLAVLFGKIKKWFSDLGSLAFKSTVAKTDLASSVQTSLGKADTALQDFTESDPTVPGWAKSAAKPDYDYSEIGGTKPPSNATVNDTDANLKNRANHTGTQAASTIDQNSSNRFVTDAEKSTWNSKSSLALGETSTTAYRGDRGKTAYDHSQSTHAPSNAQKNSDISKAEIEAKLTGEVTSHSHPVAAGTTFTGGVLDLTNTAGAFSVATTSNATTYTLSATKIIGAWCKVLINRATEPTVTGATKISGSDFAASTDMYLYAQYDGTKTEYYFAKIN